MPPLYGIALEISFPDPTNSNEWEVASILLCLKKFTTVPTPTAKGTFSVKVTKETSLVIAVAFEIV